jgi:DegV family protein with EDD domain
MNEKIALVTDSTCDLPRELTDRYQIQLVPLTIVWGEEQFRDGVDLDAEDFYRRLEVDPDLPTTSQPTPQEFVLAYDQARSQGADGILVLTLSMAMSGTYDSACRAAGLVEIPVTVMDSRANSMSLGWQVLAAARVREEGGDLEAMMAAAEAARSSMVYLVTLNTLEYLHKGGRIGGASHFIGNLLDLKPQIAVNHQTGEVEGGRRSRTRKKALGDLYEDFFHLIDTSKKMHLAVLHNNAPAEAQLLADRIKADYQPEELLLSIVSPVLGVHTGPGAVAICGYAE